MDALAEPVGTAATREWPIRFTVERGKCVEMARALRAGSDAFLASPLLAAVPTFTAVANHWGFSGSDILRDLGCELSRVLHGSEEFTYPDGLLTEGMHLIGAIRLVSRERKVNRTGRGMTAMAFETTLHDETSGRVAVRVTRTLIELDAA